MLVIIPCGSRKQSEPCEAGSMYTGSYHQMCQRYALHLAKGDRSKILILSAKYGLLAMDDRIEPYNLRMGQPGCIRGYQVRRQAEERGLVGERKVIAVGGRDYTSICQLIWPKCETPLEGIGGNGKQLAWMKEQMEEGK